MAVEDIYTHATDRSKTPIKLQKIGKILIFFLHYCGENTYIQINNKK